MATSAALSETHDQLQRTFAFIVFDAVNIFFGDFSEI